MKANIKDTGEKVLDFNIKKTKYRLGNSDRYIEIDDGDVNLPVRIQDAMNNIQSYMDELKKKYGTTDLEHINKVSTGDTEKDIEVLKEADLYVKNQINYAFDYDVSSVVFGAASSFSVTKNGDQYYFENFLNSLLPMIEKEFGIRAQAMSLRAKSYTAQKGTYSSLK